MTETLHIKNMVCDRCIEAVRAVFESKGINVSHIELGIAEIPDTNYNRNEFGTALRAEGFELIDDKKGLLINRIKSLIVNLVHHDHHPDAFKQPLSDFLQREIGHDYSYLSALFSSVEGKTIESYVIMQRIEKVKELLKYGEKTISEIAWQLNYSSVQYLSNQFKQQTGMTPSQFRSQVNIARKTLDSI